MVGSITGRRLATLIALGFFAAACSDATVGPPGRFNPATVEAGVAAVERAAASPVLVSLRVLGRAAGGMAETATTEAAGWRGDGLEHAIRRLAILTTDVSATLIPVMRASVLGTTFVYDANTRTYVPDPTRAGAPPNGVRFILYEAAVNGDPIPTREIGFADLTDEGRSSPNTASVRLVVVTGGVTRLSYSFELTGSLEAASVAVRGFLSDGTERLEFSINTSQQLFGRGGKATLDATLTVPQHDFTVTAKAEGVAGEANADGKVDLTIRSGSDVIVARGQTVEGQLDASFTVNGQLLATATGDPRSPVIRGEGGRELTDEEQHALGAIVSMADSVFKLASALLQPAGVLLVLALGVGG